MSDVIHLEGFESSIRGKKVWVVGDDSLALRRLNLSVTESLGRGRTVCIIDSHHAFPKSFQKFAWDAIFKLKDQQDLRLALTYITNATKPIHVVWIGDEMSQQIFQKLSDTSTTVIGLGSRSHVPVQPWNVIFFPHDMNSQQIEEMLLSRVGQNKLRSMNLRSILPELKTAKASLVWSTIDETERAGSLYWFDTMDGQPPEELWNPMETSMFLHDLADRIASAK
jgi:hypothetical protein